MKAIRLVVFLVLIVSLAALVLQNQVPWHLRFLWLTGEVPGIILLVITAATGFLAGVTAAFLVKRGGRPQH